MSNEITNVANIKLFDELDMSGDSESNSEEIQNVTCIAIQYIWTGFNEDVTASISTQGSNDDTNWATVDSFIPTGASSNRLLNIEKAGYAFIRCSYDQTAGVGSLTVILNSKAI